MVRRFELLIERVCDMSDTTDFRIYNASIREWCADLDQWTIDFDKSLAIGSHSLACHMVRILRGKSSDRIYVLWIQDL